MSTTVPADPAAPEALPRRRLHLLLAALMLGMLLAALDQTIVGTALPTIAGKLGGMREYSWVVTVYLLATTATTPLYGKVSDLYGRRPVFLFSIGTFLAGSLLAGMAQNMTELIATRGIQGVGGGGLITLALTIVSDVVPPRERGRYQGLFGAVFGISSIAGPLLGGYFAQSDWRLIFYLNIPLGLVAAAFAWRLLTWVPHRRRSHRVDYLGAFLLVAAVSCLLLATSWGGQEYPWGSAPVVALFAAGAVLAVVFVLAETRAAEPILPLRLFTLRTVTLACLATFVLGCALFGSIIYVPMYLQVVKGASPTASGLQMLPMMGGMIVTSTLSGRLISRVGRYKWFLVTGSVLIAAGLALLGRLETGTSVWWAGLFLAVLGVGAGLLMQPLVLAVQNAVDLRDLGIATATSTFSQSLGGSFGTAVLGAVLSTRLAEALTARLRALPGGGGSGAGGGSGPGTLLKDPAAIGRLPEAVRSAVQHAFTDALHVLFGTGAAVAVVMVVMTLLLPDTPLRGTPAAPPPAPERVPGQPAAGPAGP
ncbi:MULTISPECIES: MDR family MFS transporter [Streptomycetaceae]|nr:MULTISPECIES: MDR family MFS transporter [Streptomycetaceae]MYS60486.1 DHA2 family efflux MFS transporter permease subunit [Streptomyces sp. SID5468]CCB76286.1 putative Drug resistance transporter, emrB/qacA subfamily [Streptantibioticus cattleyicolor NRRL 8057 = DSM 46488]